MSDTPIADALAKIDALPREQAELSVTKTSTDAIAVEGDVSVATGKGTSLGAWGKWATDGAWAVAARFRWAGKA